MAVVAGDTRQVDSTHRKPFTVPADEVVAGDLVRDLGRFRTVTRVEPSVVELSLVWFFDPTDGLSDRLRVPAQISVSVWRVSRGG